MKPIWRGNCGGPATRLEGLRSRLADGGCSAVRSYELVDSHLSSGEVIVASLTGPLL